MLAALDYLDVLHTILTGSWAMRTLPAQREVCALRMGKRLLATGTFPTRGLFKAFGNEDVPNPKPFQYPPKKAQKVDGNHHIFSFCAKIHVKIIDRKAHCLKLTLRK